MPTILHRLAHWAEIAPQSAAHKFKANGSWNTLTAQEVMDRVYHLALYLESRGINATHTSTILSYNCPEWIQTEFGMQLLGAKSAGIYPNSTQKDILYIVNHMSAAVLGVQNSEYFKKIVGEQGDAALPDFVKIVIVFDGDTSVSPRAVAFSAAVEEGARLAKMAGTKSLQDLLGALDPKAGAFLIYTSGTTGNPKGAVLSQDNFCYTSDIVTDHWKLPKGRMSTFSFLPLCHVAEKIQNVGVAVSNRYAVSFCTKFENVGQELPEAEPVLMLCVPRLWEKMMEGVEHKLSRAPAARQKLARWAMGVGSRIGEAKFSGQKPSTLDLIQLPIADRLVLSKIRKALGLARTELCASGAAALGAHIVKWFRALGLEIAEDYGQTESTGIICMTERGKDGAGTVGIPVPGTEFKIAEDGEMLTKGRHVFVGYYKDEANTAATLKDGWLYTGDLATRDARGYVVIRGRKKEILKTSGGKMVAPVPIEEKLKQAEMISQVCMVGDGRKFLSAIITLSEAALKDGRQAGAINGELEVRDPAIVSLVKRHIDDLNRDLASYEQIKKFAVLSREFSIDDGEMTPTLKMKRNVIESNFKSLIDEMYNERGA